MPSPLERFAVALLLGSRWLMAPLYFGLIAALLIVLAEFFRELFHIVVDFSGFATAQVILAALKLIDLVLVGNLVLILLAAGAEIFSSRVLAEDHGGQAKWMGPVDFGALKLKIIASLVAIAAVDLLESFFNVETVDKSTILWEILILLAFGAAGVLLAVTDRLTEKH